MSFFCQKKFTIRLCFGPRLGKKIGPLGWAGGPLGWVLVPDLEKFSKIFKKIQKNTFFDVQKCFCVFLSKMFLPLNCVLIVDLEKNIVAKPTQGWNLHKGF